MAGCFSDGDDTAFEVTAEALLSTDFDDDATFNPSEDEEDPDELANLNEVGGATMNFLNFPAKKKKEKKSQTI